MDPDLNHTCPRCHQTPCIWVQHREEYNDSLNNGTLIREFGSNASGDPQNKQMRYLSYRAMSRMLNGHLGGGNRVPLPPCVIHAIRAMFPDTEGNYVGFRE